MTDTMYHNAYGHYQIGDLVGISERVKDSDDMHNYFEGDPPSATLTRVNTSTNGKLDNVQVTAHDGRTTNRTGWAIMQISGEGCMGCKNSCKRDNECAFKEKFNP